MVRSGPHQTSPHQVESANIRQQDEFLNLEREKIGKTIKKAMCIPSTRVEVVFKGKVVWPMSKVMIKPCN